MISTNIDIIYSVSLPQAVKALLESLSVAVSLGLSGVATTPLECLGLAGYVPRLLFWMILPFTLAIIIIVVVIAKRKLAKDKDSQTTLLESVLPPFNLIMFLLYPKVTQTAFDGFPCYELADGTGYLIVDVGIECRTADHNVATGLAWIAVIVYPIGLMVRRWDSSSRVAPCCSLTRVTSSFR